MYYLDVTLVLKMIVIWNRQLFWEWKDTDASMFRLMLRLTQTMARRKEGLSSTDICALLLFISQGKLVFHSSYSWFLWRKFNSWWYKSSDNTIYLSLWLIDCLPLNLLWSEKQCLFSTVIESSQLSCFETKA